MKLDELYNYKNQLMEDLLTTPEIVALINEDVSLENARSLAYSQVWPCEYIPDTSEHGKTYICFDVDVTNVSDSLILDPTLFIWVFTHKSLMRLPNGGGVRVDEILHQINNKINGSRYYGLGQLELQSVRRFAPMTDYPGKYMSYKAKEFNRTYNPMQSVPSRRPKTLIQE